MPGIVNPFRFGTGGGTFVNLTEPWEVIASTTTVATGKISIGSYDFSGLVAVRVDISGLVITTDDSQVTFRLHIDGSEVSSSYVWQVRPIIVGTTQQGAHASGSGTSIALVGTDIGEMVGNASTESFSGSVVIYKPASTNPKIVTTLCSGIRPSGDTVGWYGVGKHASGGAVTGCSVLATSDVVSGKVILSGLE